GALGVLALAWLFRRLTDGERDVWSPIAATAIAISSPLYWVTAARPLSDAMGLAAAVAVQALTLGVTTNGGRAVAALCAGLAAGIRSQVLWLTVPLIAYRCLVRPDANGSSGAHRSSRVDIRGLPARATAAGVALVAGVLAWLVPMVVATGG